MSWVQELQDICDKQPLKKLKYIVIDVETGVFLRYATTADILLSQDNHGVYRLAGYFYDESLKRMVCLIL